MEEISLIMYFLQEFFAHLAVISGISSFSFCMAFIYYGVMDRDDTSERFGTLSIFSLKVCLSLFPPLILCSIPLDIAIKTVPLTILFLSSAFCYLKHKERKEKS